MQPENHTPFDVVTPQTHRKYELRAIILAVTSSEDPLLSAGYTLAGAGCVVEILPDASGLIPRALALKPDLVLVDVQIPGPDPAEICRALKNELRTREIPVLVVAEAEARGERLAVIQAGASGLLTRPLEEDELLLAIRNVIHARRLDEMHRDFCENFEKILLMREDLTHMMVHDMRNLIQGIIANVDLLKCAMDPRSVHMHRVEALHNSAGRLLEYNNMVLDSSRLEKNQLPLKKRMHETGLIFGEAARMLGGLPECCGVHTLFPAPSESLSLLCDGDLICRVVSNLLDNAVKFSRRDGMVRVTAERVHDRVRISVSDSGKGIPAEFHQRIFDKSAQVELRRTHQVPSTGLGLAFCKLVLDAHGGQIGVHSTMGEGSTFWFEV